MNTRRNFLKSAGSLAGLVFCGCGLPTAAHAQKPTARLPVMVKGKRIKTIDVHTHCFFQQAIDLMGEDAKNVTPPVKGVKEHFIVVEQRLQGDGRRWRSTWRCSSINPVLVSQGARRRGGDLQDQQREARRDCADRKPERFGGLRVAADAGARSGGTDARNRGSRRQGLKGAAVGASVLGDDFRQSERFHPGAGEGGRARLPCCHSTRSRRHSWRARFKGNGWLSNTIGNPARHHDRAAEADLRGRARQIPRPQGSGRAWRRYLPSYAMRGDHACFVSPQNCNPTSS
jgi:aminocarboxymuconate-semialdehyde decarboxylase